jgi:ATP-dependent Lhr-like helicase
MLSPFGGRVHAAWGLALSGADPRALRPRVRRDLVRRRDHRPPPRHRRAAERLGWSARARGARGAGRRPSWAARRCSARAFARTPARALLIPRAYPGRRTPLWQQRLKAQTLLEVAKRYPDFPIVLETYRECLRDVLDLPGPRVAAARPRTARDLAGRGRDADRLAVCLLAAVRLRRHLHVRGRRAERGAPRGGAVARPRAAARAARPGGAARADRPGALAALEADLRAARRDHQATSRDELHDVLRTLGDLTAAEVRERVLDALDSDAMLASWCASAARSRCAWRARSATSPRRTPGSTATRSA